MLDINSTETPEEKRARKRRESTERVREWRKTHPDSWLRYYRRKKERMTPDEREQEKKRGRKWMKEWRANNPEKSLCNSRANHAKNRKEDCERSRKRCMANRSFLEQILQLSVCWRCGEPDNKCLVFHHRDPSNKKYDMSRAAAHSRVSLLNELVKCDIVCHNCHLRLHSHDSKVCFWFGKTIKSSEPSCKKNAKAREYNRNRYRKNKELLDAVKSERGCERCQELDAIVLQFHHRDPEKRGGQVASFCGFSWKKMLIEVEKCEVLCANCHAKEHYHERRLPRSQRKRERNKEKVADR